MPTLNFDAVVVGAGPAGSSAAYQLASRGLSVALIDRSSFPRDKLCGGLVTQRCQKMFAKTFDRLLEEDLYLTSSHIAFYLRSKFLREHKGYSDMHFVMRRQFDQHLLSLAQSKGVATFLNTVITDIALAHNSITLIDGIQLRFKYLVGADGVNSQVSKAALGVSMNLETVGFALEVEIPREELPEQNSRIEIDFGVVRWGYGWCFPKRSTITIGVGGVLAKNAHIKSCMQDYLRLKGLNPETIKFKGHHIPFGDYKKNPGRMNVLLVGDAAGVVDPITGEGIAYAIETGALAASAIATACKQNTPDAMCFYQVEYNGVVSELRAANFWRRLIFPDFVFKNFSNAFAHATTLQRGFLDIMAGEHGYAEVPRLFFVQLLQGIRRRIKNVILRLR